MLDKERDALITEIRKVFAKNPRPKRIGDELWSLEGKAWQNLSVADVLSNHAFLSFSAQGFRYFLPGYMVVMLQNPKKMEREFVTEYLLKYLTQEYPEFPKLNLQKLDLYNTFNDKERQIILRFLDLFEPLWIPYYNDLEERLLRVEPKLRYSVRKDYEDRCNKLRTLLQKAKQYWR